MKTLAEPISPPATMRRRRSKPLLPIRGVCSLVDKSAERVLEMIEEGAIAWAFDVSLDQKRREIRVLPAAAADYLKGKACELKWSDVLGLMLPDAPTVSALEITRVLNVCGDHTYALIDRKRIVACPTRRRGPGGSARVPANSFIQFLRKRRVV
jgi:hypothetical protein